MRRIIRLSRLRSPLPTCLPGGKTTAATTSLREGSEGFLEAYARTHDPSYKSDLARYHALKYAFLRGHYAQVLELKKDLTSPPFLDPCKKKPVLLIGYAAYKEKNQKLSAARLRPLTERSGPYHDAANYYLGVMAYEQGDFMQAARFFEAVQTKNPYRLAVPLWLAYSLGQAKAYDRLAAQVERWLTMDPEPWYRDTLWPYVAVTLAQGGLCDKATEIKPAETHPLARWWIGVCYARQKAWDKAVAAWEALTDREDTLGGWVAYGLAYVFAAQNRWEEALLSGESCCRPLRPPRRKPLWL